MAGRDRSARWAVAGVFTLASCAFDASVPAGAIVSCRISADCPAAEVCLAVAGRCVSADAPCLVVTGREATAQPPGNACAGGICIDGSCVLPRCGDAVVTSPEACDDGNGDDDDGCTEACALPRCGDGVVQRTEACDDGNTESGDGCRGDCLKVEACGDDEFDTGEACDDGNDNPADGCDACLVTSWAVSVLVPGAADQGPADDIPLGNPRGIAFDARGRLFIADYRDDVVRRLDPDGTITTVAGNGIPGFSGDGGSATAASFSHPHDVAIDGAGRLIIADGRPTGGGNNRVRRVELDGTVVTVAGAGNAGYAGDGGPAAAALLNSPLGVEVDAQGRLVICDSVNHAIRRIDTDGSISTLIDVAVLFEPLGVGLDAQGRVLVADSLNSRVLRREDDGSVVVIAGTGEAGYNGDGIPATTAQLRQPFAVTADVQGRVLIADAYDNRVRRVELDGTITTIAGTGAQGFDGDGEPAGDALLDSPRGLAVDELGRVLIADSDNGRIRRVELDGRITTIAGGGTLERSPGLSARLNGPVGVAFDPAGRVHFDEQVRNRILRVENDGTLTTVAGNGELGDAPDEAPATSAPLSLFGNEGGNLAFDATGRLLFVEPRAFRVRRVELDGTLSTFAGTGVAGFSGDGGPATAADMQPYAIAVDEIGRVLIMGALRVRRVELDGTIHTIPGGAGWEAYSAASDGQGGVYLASFLPAPAGVYHLDALGAATLIAGGGPYRHMNDGESATSGTFFYGINLTTDLEGRVIVADTDARCLRRIEQDGTIGTVAGTCLLAGFAGDGGPATAGKLAYPLGLARDASGRIAIADRINQAIRLVDSDGMLTTVAGPIDPPGAGPFARAKLLTPAALTPVGPWLFVPGGPSGRVMRLDLVASTADVVAGYAPAATPNGADAARYALLDDVGGAVFDGVDIVYLAERGRGALLALRLVNPADASTWTVSTMAVSGLRGPAGLALDQSRALLYVADEGDHCVRAVDLASLEVAVVAGRCGVAGGVFDDATPATAATLNRPRHLALGPAGRIYISDSGNHRVRVLDADGMVRTVVGDGSPSSAGAGSPARTFPVQAPEQLALDSRGNLLVASTHTVRLVANVDGDEAADGDDRALTIYGAPPRAAFPENSTACLSGLTLAADDLAYLADACRGILVALQRTR